MKLKKLDIDVTNIGSVLTRQEMNTYVGGYGNNNGSCFFNCLEYLNKKYECRDGWDYSSYAKDYATGDASDVDEWNGTATKDESEGIYGPKLVNLEEGKLNNEPFEYLKSCFDTEGSAWTVGSNVANLFGSTMGSNSTILGTFVSGSDMTHAAIFTGYDNGKYTYYDPATGCTGVVDASRVVCGAKINGCK